MSDVDPQYMVAPGEFVLDERYMNRSQDKIFIFLLFPLSTKNIIGKGGFGEVYRATFRKQTVAVKLFSQKVASINNTTPNHLIRQEVSTTPLLLIQH